MKVIRVETVEEAMSILVDDKSSQKLREEAEESGAAYSGQFFKVCGERSAFHADFCMEAYDPGAASRFADTSAGLIKITAGRASFCDDGERLFTDGQA